MKMSRAAFALPLLFAVGHGACASREPNVKAIDTTLEARGSTGTDVVGINKDGDAILQQEHGLGSEIRVAQHVNENIRMNINTEFYHVKECWKNRARGTTQEMPELTEFADVGTGIKAKEEIGLVGNDVKVIRREDAVARLNAEKRHQEELRANLTNVRKQREKCEFEAARDTAKKKAVAGAADSDTAHAGVPDDAQ